MMRGCGQVSPDYLIAIIFLGIMALGIFGAYEHMQLQAYDAMDRLFMKDIAERISGSVNSVLVMGSGAEKSIILPASLGDGSKYNLTVRSNAVLVSSSDSDYAARFASTNINQTEIKLKAGVLLIKNVNGKIYFERLL